MFIEKEEYLIFIRIRCIYVSDYIPRSDLSIIGSFKLFYKKSKFSKYIKSESFQKVMKFFYIDTKWYQRLSLKLLSESSEFENYSRNTIKADYQRVEKIWIKLPEIDRVKADNAKKLVETETYKKYKCFRARKKVSLEV
jgi:hypothetical protein